MAKRLYVAATGQHVGKTTSTLGLVSTIHQMGVNVGYSKPVGQQHVTYDGLTVDKDVVLFSQFMNFPISEIIHSPVIIGDGITGQYLDDPSQFNFEARLDASMKHLDNMHDLVVYEGTGHTGVGSVVNLSNADVAKRLNAQVIMIVEGGIGKTIDKLNMCMALFREKNVPIMGVILNKVYEDKIEKVTHYVGKKLKDYNIPLLGVMPYEKSLSYPIMETVKYAVNGRVVLNEGNLSNMVEDIVAGSLIDTNELSNMHNVLLVVSAKRLNEAINKVKSISKSKNLEGTPISGVIITGDGRHDTEVDNLEECIDYFQEHGIPLISTMLDTYGSVVKISKIEVKINTRTPWKVERAVQMIHQHVDLDYILDSVMGPGFKKKLE